MTIQQVDAIFTDCQGAVKAIEKWKAKKTKAKNKDENRAIMKGIAKLIEERINTKLGKVELIWVPSHTADKKKKMTQSMKDQIEVLRERFGNDIDTIIDGNSWADEIAGMAAREDKKKRWVHPEADNYVLIQKGEMYEGKITKLVLSKKRKEYARATKDMSGWGGMDRIDMKASNKIFQSRKIEDMILGEKLFKGRMNAARLPGTEFFKGAYGDKSASVAKRAIWNPTPECEMCESGYLCDMIHLWVCEGTHKYRKC